MKRSAADPRPRAIAIRSIGFGTPFPAIAVAVALFATALFAHALWVPAAVLFVVGWLFQLIGHAFERKAPEFLKDWRFLFVGLRWWFAKLRGKA